MNSFMHWLFGSDNFMPHGMCYLWLPDVLWLNVGSDALIAASYFAIPAVLGHFVRRRRNELPFPWIPYLFASFIFLCGTTHVMSIWTVWNPNYRLDGFIKLATGLVSITTAVALIWVMPRAMTLRTPSQLQREVDDRTADLLAANERLRNEISARERTERELRESEQRFRRIADVMPHIVYVSKPGGSTEYINARWKEYTGYDSAEFEKMSAIVPEDELIHVREVVADAARRKETYSCELRMKRASDGSYRWFLTNGAPVLDEHGDVIRWVGSTVDIDDRKRAEEELREADRKKDEFLAVLAHELRNPLFPIKNALTIFERAKVEDKVLNQARAIMQRQIIQLARLVDDLIDVSRIRMNRIELRREKLDLRNAVNDAVEVAQPIIDAAKQTLAVDLPTEPIHVDGDLVRLTQVIGNLLSNSSKYSPPDAAIHLSVRALPETVEIIVSDQGTGIVAEDLPRIFDLFVQVGDGDYKTKGGLGIGLALVRRLVELHGGTITAKSDGLGLGSTFIVRLQRYRE